jgi:glutathione S-transferase
MTLYTVHHAPLTRSVRAVWALRELGLEHEVVERPLIDFVMDKSYRQLSPAGKVPCVRTPEGAVWIESLAILQLLFETRAPGSPLWRPPGHPQRAALLQWMNYGETVQVHLQNLNQQLFFLRPAEARSAPTIKLELARLNAVLRPVDATLSRQEYLLADGFSAADIALGYTVAVSNLFRPLDDRPALVAYVQRLLKRPAVHGILELPAPLPQPLV